MTDSNSNFPALIDWSQSRESLHGYAKILGAIQAAHNEAHPKWWHVSLKPYTSGLTTANIPHPSKNGKHFSLSLDLRNHYLLFSGSSGEVSQIRMADAFSTLEMEEKIKALLVSDGVTGEIDSSKFADHEIKSYSMDKVEKYFSALSQISKIFDDLHKSINGEKSPVQFWPHHFDLAFEIFGKLPLDEKKNNEGESYPPQIGIGFAASDETNDFPYFYVNPYPFKDEFRDQSLHSGASWHLEGWNGAMLPYSVIADNQDGSVILKAFLELALSLQENLIAS